VIDDLCILGFRSIKLIHTKYRKVNFMMQKFDITNADVKLDTIIGESEPKENSSTFRAGW